MIDHVVSREESTDADTMVVVGLFALGAAMALYFKFRDPGGMN
jgi:hypothetical protein